MKRLMYFINHNHSYTTAVQGNEMEVELGVGMAGGIVEEEEEENMDTLTMELVDQMEIEISDTDQDDGLEAKTIKVEPHSVKPPLLKVCMYMHIHVFFQCVLKRFNVVNIVI